MTLVVSGSTAAGNATLTLLDQGSASAGADDNARIVLTTTDTNAWAKVDVAGGTLYDAGRIIVDPGAGDIGGRYWHGDVLRGNGRIEINESLAVLGAEPWRTDSTIAVASGKTLRVDSGLAEAASLEGSGTVVQGDVSGVGLVSPGGSSKVGALTISGNYIQKAWLETEIEGPGAGQFDVLHITGAASLRGAGLLVSPRFWATLGQTFPILTAASLSGTFRNVYGAVIDTGLYYAPTYSPTGVTLQVKQATLNIAPSQGPPGTSVKVTGSNWTGNEVWLWFVDRARHKFKFPTAVDGSGNFSTTITIPANAAPGAGKIRASSPKVRRLKLERTFTVT
jgi:hypothetical protein